MRCRDWCFNKKKEGAKQKQQVSQRLISNIILFEEDIVLLTGHDDGQGAGQARQAVATRLATRMPFAVPGGIMKGRAERGHRMDADESYSEQEQSGQKRK